MHTEEGSEKRPQEKSNPYCLDPGPLASEFLENAFLLKPPVCGPLLWEPGGQTHINTDFCEQTPGGFQGKLPHILQSLYIY